MRGKRGRGAGKKTPVFLLRYPSCPFARRNAKMQSHEFIRSNIALPKSYCPS
nr:hypothetical protein [Campylobacter troglodytis]